MNGMYEEGTMIRAMSTALGAGVLALVLCTAAAHAHEEPGTDGHGISGVFDLGGGVEILREDSLSNPDDADYGLIAGGARVNLPITDSFDWQVDLDSEALFIKKDSDSNYIGSVLGATHLSWRDPETGLLGVFGGGGVAFQADDDDHAKHYFVGVEGQYYFDSVTAYLQGGFLDGHQDNKDAIRDGGFVRGVGRYFLNETTMLQAEGSYAQGNTDSGRQTEAVVTGWGGRAETMVGDWPVAVFMDYQGNRYLERARASSNSRLTDHTFLFGVRFLIGQPNLLANDRNGATLDLPPIGRWQGQFGDVVD